MRRAQRRGHFRIWIILTLLTAAGFVWSQVRATKSADRAPASIATEEAR